MKKNKKGFTLVELLVVIAIIGLLSTLTVLSLNSARARARDARRISDVKQIQTALEMYFNDNLLYPTSTNNIASTSVAAYLAVWPTPPTPVDVSASCNFTPYYTYAQTSAGASYTLNYCLGATSSGVNTGVHTAWPGGIQ